MEAGCRRGAPVSPRDYFTVVGDTLLVGKLINGYKDILAQIDRKNIKWFLDSFLSVGSTIYALQMWLVFKIIKNNILWQFPRIKV